MYQVSIWPSLFKTPLTCTLQTLNNVYMYLARVWGGQYYAPPTKLPHMDVDFFPLTPLPSLPNVHISRCMLQKKLCLRNRFTCWNQMVKDQNRFCKSLQLSTLVTSLAHSIMVHFCTHSLQQFSSMSNIWWCQVHCCFIRICGDKQRQADAITVARQCSECTWL